jgi:predicted DCC family thiol-disulfide oxidoreductase YuxK
VFWIFMLVPRPVRDWIYDFVARHRYRWFGKRDVCMVPTSEIRARFLEMS